MTSRADPTHFDAVDGNDADFFVEFLDARTTIPTEVLIKRHILAELQLSGGLSVLDVGSGTGADTCDAAAAVLPGGSVIGVDVSTHMVEEGRRRAAALGIPAEFVRGDVRDLAFPDATFDRCRAERVLAVVDGEPEAAIRELARVTKPGGLVVVSEIDAGTLFVNSTDSAGRPARRRARHRPPQRPHRPAPAPTLPRRRPGRRPVRPAGGPDLGGLPPTGARRAAAPAGRRRRGDVRDGGLLLGRHGGGRRSGLAVQRRHRLHRDRPKALGA